MGSGYVAIISALSFLGTGYVLRQASKTELAQDKDDQWLLWWGWLTLTCTGWAAALWVILSLSCLYINPQELYLEEVTIKGESYYEVVYHGRSLGLEWGEMRALERQ